MEGFCNDKDESHSYVTNEQLNIYRMFREDLELGNYSVFRYVAL
jgi:hypothetical protein